MNNFFNSKEGMKNTKKSTEKVEVKGANKGKIGNEMVELLQKQLNVYIARDKEMENIVQRQIDLITTGDMTMVNIKQIVERVQNMMLEIGQTAKITESVPVMVKT